jgi:hypothetical protein
MSRIFISYRRDDTAGYAGRLFDRLSQQFGSRSIFMDIDTIEPGEDFVKVIEDAVGSCNVLIALIGQHWLTLTDSAGRRRIDSPNDFVKLEIATALKRDIRVIPVLVRGVQMPTLDVLPKELTGLERRNALVINDKEFHHQIDGLITSIDKLVNDSKPSDKPIMSGINSEEIRNLTVSHARQILITDLLPPPFEWCNVMGGVVESADEVESGESSQGLIKVSPFSMAKYPITNAQYNVFVDANDGYCNAEWWEYSIHAKEWHNKNPKPAPPAFLGDDLPRTIVNWYDATAFCRWLNAKSNVEIALPSEVQWLRAAIGDTKNLYPWGNELDESYCNYGHVIGQPTPVSRYVLGSSPFGVVDICGNVWEWTRNVRVQREHVSMKRLLVGGAWNSDSSELSSTLRYWQLPQTQNDTIGFRVCILQQV